MSIIITLSFSWLKLPWSVEEWRDFKLICYGKLGQLFSYFIEVGSALLSSCLLNTSRLVPHAEFQF